MGRTVRLTFGPEATTDEVDVRQSLSAVARRGETLWLASDETAAIERLEATGKGYGHHRRFDLHDHLVLEGADDEVDIEGLDVDGDALWLVGSHSRRRSKMGAAARDDGEDGGRAAAALAEVHHHPNRSTLARIPLVERDGSMELDGPGAGLDAGALHAALEGDAHLGPFLTIPGKDNGFDVEGLAVLGDRVVLGLRGPVLRGWAVLLELRPGPITGDPPGFDLEPFADGARCRKHFLDLGGLGVRDLTVVGDDLLVLAGPSMSLAYPTTIHRWRGGAVADGTRVVSADRLGAPIVGPVPANGQDHDHAEGITALDDEVLVVFDGPAPARLHGDGAVDADRLRLER